VRKLNQQKRKLAAAILSVISNSALIIMKIAAGILSGSVSIISEAIHSFVDLLAAFIALFSVKTSHTPPDSAHPFGHGKIENISGAIEALLIFLAAVWIISEAIDKILYKKPLVSLDLAIVVMMLSALVNWRVAGFLFKVGGETDSIALEADAWHLQTDVYTSLGVMASLAFIRLGNLLFPEVYLQWLDPVCAIAVALLITHTAYKLTLRSAQDLLDARLPEDEEAWLRRLIAEYQPALHGFHKLRTRKAGNFRFVEFHIKVDPAMSVETSHDITEDLSVHIEERFPGASVTIHTEPCDKCEGNCLKGCLLSRTEREDMHRRVAGRNFHAGEA